MCQPALWQRQEEEPNDPMEEPVSNSNSIRDNMNDEQQLIPAQPSGLTTATKKRPRNVNDYSTPRSKLCSSSGDIRSKLLNRLGLPPSPPSSPSTAMLIAPVTEPAPTRPTPLTLHEPLKCGTPMKQQSAAAKIGEKSRRKVSFDASVKVRQIPMRTEYSDRIRKHLWSSPVEMRECVSRNAYEFAAENWNWRQVAEDDDMVHLDNGDRIHPAHYVRAHNLQRQFFMVMAARCGSPGGGGPY